MHRMLAAYTHDLPNECFLLVPQLQKVLLEADVEGLGKKGKLVEVKAAYATNVIVAKGLGSVASKAMVDQIAKTEAEAITAAAEAKKGASEMKATLQKRYAKGGIIFEVPVAKDGSIDTVSGKDVAAELSRMGTAVQAENVEMTDITEAGTSEVATLQLHPEVVMSVKVEVLKSKISISY